MFVTGSALPVTDLARACEERGLESLWVPEHPVVPARHETRYPLSDDGKLPRPYTELPDCFATLAAAAGVTRRLRLGTGICLVPERDPLLTADKVAGARRTIEQLARARGRDPDRISVSVMIGAPPGLESSALDLMPSHEVLVRYAEAGADRVIVSVPTLAADDAHRHLDRIAAARP